MSRPQQVQHQHQQDTGSSSTLLDLDDIFLGTEDEESGQQGNVTFKDQVREDLLSASLATAAAAATPPTGRVAAATVLAQQRQRCCIVFVAALLNIAAAVAAGICGTVRCSSPTPSPVPPPVPPITATARAARADTILPYINGITLSGRTLKYPSSSSSAEERAVRWLIEDDLGTAVDDELSLRQRYVLGILWFSQPTSPTTYGFGSAKFATTWTTNMDECEWFEVGCNGNGRLTNLNLWYDNVRGQIPDDLGLLTDLTTLQLGGNQLSGTIPSSLGALTALTSLSLYNNQLVGTITSSLVALTALDDLSLGNNQLSGTIPLSLVALTALDDLSLGNNQLSGTIPLSIGALTALTWLSLGDNQLSGTIPSSIGALRALSSLWLNDNQLVGTMPFCNSDQSIEYLVADCAKVNCTCCTHCCPTAFSNIPVFEYCG
jgi:hypothetical protein